MRSPGRSVVASAPSPFARSAGARSVPCTTAAVVRSPAACDGSEKDAAGA